MIVLSDRARSLMIDMLDGPVFLSHRWHETRNGRRKLYSYTRAGGTLFHRGEALVELVKPAFVDLCKAPSNDIELTPWGRVVAWRLKVEAARLKAEAA